MNGRTVAAWLALFGLVLQIGLAAAHSARHFDHLVGIPGGAAVAAASLAHDCNSDAARSEPPAGQDRHRCAVDLALAASGAAILGDPALVPAPLSFAATRLGGNTPAPTLAQHRHRLPLARAPPVIEIPV